MYVGWNDGIRERKWTDGETMPFLIYSFLPPKRIECSTFLHSGRSVQDLAQARKFEAVWLAGWSTIKGTKP